MKRSQLRLLIVLAVLALFPFLSWYYLQKGIDYRVEAMEELGEMGEFYWINTYDQRDRFIDEEIFINRYVVAGFAPEDTEDVELFRSRITGLIEQFGSRDDVKYISIVNESEGRAEEKTDILSGIFMGSVHRNHILVQYSEEEVKEIKGRWFSGLTDMEGGFRERDYMVLFNEGGKAIQIYNFREESRIARLVEHLSMILPQKQDRRDYSDAIRERL